MPISATCRCSCICSSGTSASAACCRPAYRSISTGTGGEFIYAAVALGLYYAAFISEDLRSGLRSIPKGQYESALAIGLSPAKILLLVILPQALRHALPPTVNQALSLFKNTSIAAALGVAELMYRSREIATETFRVFEAFSIATLVDLTGSLIIVGTGLALERWLRIPTGARAMIELIEENGLYLLLGEYPNGPLGGLSLTLLLAASAMALVLPFAVLVALARTSGRRPLVWGRDWLHLAGPLGAGAADHLLDLSLLPGDLRLHAQRLHDDRGGHRDLPDGLSVGGAARRHRGAAGRPGRSRAGAGPALLADHAAHRAAPGARQHQPRNLNVLTVIVKETSLGYMVGLGELTLTASHINSLTLTMPLEIFFLLSLIYFAICYGIGSIVAILEGGTTWVQRQQAGDRSTAATGR